MDSLTIKHANAMPAPTWGWLRMNDTQIEIPMSLAPGGSMEVDAEDRLFDHAMSFEGAVAELQARGTMERPTWLPTGSFRWPCSGRISSRFGYRNTGIAGASTYHKGIDIGNSYGTPILAADGGTVTYAGWMSGYGYLIIIDHGNGYETYYGHNSSLVASVGEKVYKGQQVARMGSTGISSGNHCHFGVKKNGTFVNPLNYLP